MNLIARTNKSFGNMCAIVCTDYDPGNMHPIACIDHDSGNMHAPAVFLLFGSVQDHI